MCVSAIFPQVNIYAMRGKIRLDGRKSSLTSKGFPIIFYLTKDSKEKPISTGYYSFKEHWDAKNALPLKMHPNYVELLNYLDLKKILLKKLLEESKLKAVNFHYAENFLKNSDSDIFYKEGIKLSDANKKRTYRIALDSFQSFFPDYSFEMIDKIVAKTYMQLLLNTPTKNSRKIRKVNGVISYMNTLTAIWNHLDKPNNPFSKIRPAAEPTKNKALTIEDLNKIKNNNYKIHGNSYNGGVKRYLDYFLLCFYLGGIDLGDLKRLTYSENVINGRVEFIRSKGGTNVFVSNLIPEEALVILKNYDCKPHLIPLGRMKNYHDFIPNISRYLGDVQENLGLSKKPYSKAPRYTFITLAQQKLIDERITIEIVGHAQQSTHSIYKDQFPYHVRDEAHLKIIELEK